jgi:phage tail-like protein
MTGFARNASPRRTGRWVADRARLLRRLALATVLAGVGVSAIATSGFGQLAGEPITAVHYSITIDGVEIASFQELSGINEEVDPVRYWESTAGARTAKQKPPSATLKRGLTGSLELWAWHQAVRTGTQAQARKTVGLVMYDVEGRPVVRYWLHRAWPSKLDVAGLTAGGAEPLTETVTLTAERIQRVSP